MQFPPFMHPLIQQAFTPMHGKWCKTSPLDGWRLSGWCITMVSHCRTPHFGFLVTIVFCWNANMQGNQFLSRSTSSPPWLTGNVTMRVGKTSVLQGMTPAAAFLLSAKRVYLFICLQLRQTEHRPKWGPWHQQVGRLWLWPTCNKNVWKMLRQQALVTSLHMVALNTIEITTEIPVALMCRVSAPTLRPKIPQGSPVQKQIPPQGLAKDDVCNMRFCSHHW